MSIGRASGKVLLGIGYAAANVALYKIGKRYPQGLFGAAPSLMNLENEIRYLKELEKLMILALFVEPALLKVAALLLPLNVYQYGRYSALAETEQQTEHTAHDAPCLLR